MAEEPPERRGNGGESGKGEGEKEPKEDEKLEGKRSDHQYWMGVLFILGFFFFLAYAYSFFIGSQGSKVSQDGMSFIGTLFAGWVGTIIGFYFGQKPVEQVKEQLKTQQDANQKDKEWFKERLGQILNEAPGGPNGKGKGPATPPADEPEPEAGGE